MKKKSASQSAFFNSRVLIGFFVCLIGATLALFITGALPGSSALAQASAQNQNTGGQHKVSITNRALVPDLVTHGGRVIADYGSSILLEVNDAAAKRLTNSSGAQIVDENNLIMLNAGAIDTSTAEAQAKRTASDAKGGKGMRLIQFAGPIKPEWYQALVATGARIVTSIPSNSYLVYGTADRLQAVQSLASNNAAVQWDGPYTAAYRLDPKVTRVPSAKEVEAQGGTARPNLSDKGNEQFVIQLVEDANENADTLALIERAKVEPIISQDKALGYVNVKVAMPKEALNQIAERGDVVSIQQYVTPVMMCERQDMIMAGNLTGNVPNPGDYLAYLTGKGYNLGAIANFGVNVSDTGLDNGTTTGFMFLLYRLGDSTLPADSRVSYVVQTGTAAVGDLPGCNGHGNLNCTIIGGYVPTGTVGGVNFAAFPHADASAFRWGLGIAPFVKIGMSVIFTTGGAFTNPVYETLESNAYAAGMRISSNSWGAAVGGAYNTDSQRYDALVRDAQTGTAGNQEYTIVFSAGNSGSAVNTIGSPGTGKNVITVGAGEDVNPFGGADGSGVGDTGADSANDIISFSSRGPCDDGRKKPEIMGPGTHVSGGAPQNAANPARTGNGNILACFTGGGVSGGVAPNKFFPAGQTWYTASSGTSHSCPAVAGTVALYRQYFIDHAMTPPSPAMNKALLMNSARYMTGTGAGDTLYSNNQGMGEANLNSFFDIFTTGSILRDEVAGDTFTASGQIRNFAGNVVTNAKPFRVTLVWTDPPGPTTGNAFINNLDLEVTVGGNTYKGNVFTGANSTTGGAADVADNAESVFLPAGVSGGFSVKVTGTNIAGDGVPGNAQPLDQDFALIINNGAIAAGNVIAASGSSIISAGPNNALDPGETVTVALDLQNIGSGCTTALTGTLAATGGVTSPSAPQNYGAVCAPGASVSRNFTFTVDPAVVCGANVTATLNLQDGATSYPAVTYVFGTGSTVVTPVQNFDGVVAPALPAGWTTTFSGTGTASTTVTTFPDTAPNADFTSEATNVGLSEVTSPPIAITNAGTQLSFRNEFNTESTFDGKVLEISIPSVAGGAFQDILAVGGTFASGGYNSTLSTGFSNPLPGRMAWTGLSGGTAAAPTYITTVVNLPAAATGQSVQFKWRQGSDNSVAPTNPGSRIDTITLSSLVCQTGGAPVPSSAVSRKVHGAAGPFDVNLPLVAIGGAVGVECRSGPAHTMVITFPTAVTVGSVAVTNGTGAATFSVAGAVVTVNLTGVTDVQRLGVTLSNVNNGSVTGNVFVPMGVLAGDTNASGGVSAADVSQTKAQSGNPAVLGNFRTDVNASGGVSAADISLVKARSGNLLPP